MVTYRNALAQLPAWERFKMRCESVWLEILVRLPKRFWMARIRRECGR